LIPRCSIEIRLIEFPVLLNPAQHLFGYYLNPRCQDACGVAAADGKCVKRAWHSFTQSPSRIHRLFAKSLWRLSAARYPVRLSASPFAYDALVRLSHTLHAVLKLAIALRHFLNNDVRAARHILVRGGFYEKRLGWILNLWVGMSFRCADQLPMLPNKSREESHGMV
jgi:hypothetical protein